MTSTRRDVGRRPGAPSADVLATDEAAAARSQLRARALGLLARREHSVSELKLKLTRRGADGAQAAEVVAALSERGLVSDERFVASYIEAHASRGRGPIRIRDGLRQAGVDVETIDSALETCGIDWIDQARTVRRRKFGGTLPGSFPERAKQARFLQYRGFSPTQVRAATGADPDDSE